VTFLAAAARGATLIARMVAVYPDTMGGIRDKALISLAFAAGLQAMAAGRCALGNRVSAWVAVL